MKDRVKDRSIERMLRNLRGRIQRVDRQRRSYLLSLFIFALYISFFSVISLESASAQSDWKKIFTTTDGSEIDCGFFFDENTGFIGSGIRDYAAASALIYKTTDGGKSWKRMQTPFVDSSAVTSIFMVDQKIGYASIFATEGSESIWKTINGGNSWSDISPSYSGFAPCVYATSKAIILTQWGVIAGVSIDGGANFNSIFSGAIEESNGIDFTDDLHGVVTMGPEMPPNSTPISY